MPFVTAPISYPSVSRCSRKRWRSNALFTLHMTVSRPTYNSLQVAHVYNSTMQGIASESKRTPNVIAEAECKKLMKIMARCLWKDKFD